METSIANWHMVTMRWKPASQKETYGDYRMETSIANWHMVTMRWKPASQKETSPLAHFVRNSLPHKSFRFCSPMLTDWIEMICKQTISIQPDPIACKPIPVNHASNHFKIISPSLFKLEKLFRPMRDEQLYGSSIPATSSLNVLLFASHPNICRAEDPTAKMESWRVICHFFNI